MYCTLQCSLVIQCRLVFMTLCPACIMSISPSVPTSIWTYSRARRTYTRTSFWSCIPLSLGTSTSVPTSFCPYVRVVFLHWSFPSSMRSSFSPNLSQSLCPPFPSPFCLIVHMSSRTNVTSSFWSFRSSVLSYF